MREPIDSQMDNRGVADFFSNIIEFPQFPFHTQDSGYEKLRQSATVGRVLGLVFISCIGVLILFEIIAGNPYISIKVEPFLLCFLMLVSFLIQAVMSFLCFRGIGGNADLVAHAYLSGLSYVYYVLLPLLSLLVLGIIRIRGIDNWVFALGGLYLLYVLFKSLQALHGVSIAKGIMGFVLSIIASVPFVLLHWFLFSYFRTAYPSQIYLWQPIFVLSGLLFVALFILAYALCQQKLTPAYDQGVPITEPLKEMLRTKWVPILLVVLPLIPVLISFGVWFWISTRFAGFSIEPSPRNITASVVPLMAERRLQPLDPSGGVKYFPLPEEATIGVSSLYIALFTLAYGLWQHIIADESRGDALVATGLSGTLKRRWGQVALVVLLTVLNVIVLSSAKFPSVIVDVRRSDNSPVIPLTFPVIDAEYSLAIEHIVIVSADPNQLHIYDPETGDDVAVDLSYPPTSVSVGPDGKFAAVGHDAQISYVDLQSAQVVKILDVTGNVFDIVLASNGWVYSSLYYSSRDERNWFRAVEIATNTEVEFLDSRVLPEAFGETVYRLHPDGQSLYAADPFCYSRGAVFKLDITGNTPIYVHDSHYRHPASKHKACANLWLSQDGQYVFTACGHVFSASSEREEDLIRIDQLSDAKYIGSLAQSGTAQRVVAIASGREQRCFDPPDDTSIYIYEYPGLRSIATRSLPEFAVQVETDGLLPDVSKMTFSSEGRFVFINAAGSHYYIIVQAFKRAGASSGLPSDFGLIICDF
jgi:hypothetical protein